MNAKITDCASYVFHFVTLPFIWLGRLVSTMFSCLSAEKTDDVARESLNREPLINPNQSLSSLSVKRNNQNPPKVPFPSNKPNNAPTNPSNLPSPIPKPKTEPIPQTFTEPNSQPIEPIIPQPVKPLSQEPNSSNKEALSKEVIIKKIVQDPKYLQEIKNHSNYTEIAIAAVKQNPECLKHVDPEQEDYAEIAIAAVKKKPECLKYVDPKQEDYTEIATAAVKKKPEIFWEQVHVDHKDYVDIALVALKRNMSLLKQEGAVKNPKYQAIATRAVKEYLNALKNVDSSHDNYAAIVKNGTDRPEELQYVDPEHASYNKIAKDYLNRWPNKALKYIKKDHKSYRELAKYSVEKRPASLKYVQLEPQDYKEFVLSCLEKNPECLQYVNTKSKDYPEFVLFAVNQKSSCLQYVNSNRKDYKKIAAACVKAVVAKDPNIVKYVKSPNYNVGYILDDYLEIMADAVEGNKEVWDLFFKNHLHYKHSIQKKVEERANN